MMVLVERNSYLFCIMPYSILYHAVGEATNHCNLRVALGAVGLSDARSLGVIFTLDPCPAVQYTVVLTRCILTKSHKHDLQLYNK